MSYKSFFDNNEEINYKNSNLEDSTFYDRYNRRFYSNPKENLPYDRFQRKKDFIAKSIEEDFILRINFTYPNED
jgi:hypothetical protein